MSKKPKVGRPRKFREKTKTISKRVPISKAKKIEAAFDVVIAQNTIGITAIN